MRKLKSDRVENDKVLWGLVRSLSLILGGSQKVGVPCCYLLVLIRDVLLLSMTRQARQWAHWETPDSEVQAVAETFVFANCYNQQAAGVMLSQPQQCQVSES